jgi:hypothetical protein
MKDKKFDLRKLNYVDWIFTILCTGFLVYLNYMIIINFELIRSILVWSFDIGIIASFYEMVRFRH